MIATLTRIAEELRQLGDATDAVTTAVLNKLASRLEDAVLSMQDAGPRDALDSLESLQTDRDVLHDRLAVVNEGIRRLGG